MLSHSNITYLDDLYPKVSYKSDFNFVEDEFVRREGPIRSRRRKLWPRKEMFTVSRDSDDLPGTVTSDTLLKYAQETRFQLMVTQGVCFLFLLLFLIVIALKK